MNCLELYINGKRVCVVGRADVDNYHANVIQWRSKDRVEVSAGGGTGILDDVSETFSWGSQFIGIGDEVLVRVVENEIPDEPIEIRKHNHKESMEEMERNIAEIAAKLRLRIELEGKDAVLGTSAETPEYCSFCGKAKDEVEKMIAGPSILICSECVAVCNDILQGKDPAESPPKWPEPRR